LSRELQRRVADMLEVKAQLLQHKTELEGATEGLTLERDRAARACELAIKRLHSAHEHMEESEHLSPGDPVGVEQGAQQLISKLINKCASLKRGKDKLKRQIHELRSGQSGVA